MRFPPSYQLIAAFFCIFFVLAGQAFAPELGIQNDEALFAAAIYPPDGARSRVNIAGFSVPLMLMSYLGTLKSWIYTVLLLAEQPSLWIVRTPVLLIGTSTIILLASFLHSVHGARAAAFGAALLATDPIVLLTTVFDWGPVALQHLLTVAGLLLIVRRRPGWAFFCFGLALWNKGLFIWTLGALAVAALLVFPRETLRYISARRVSSAAAGFLLGALPLIVFNLQEPLLSVRENSALDLPGLPGKAELLLATADGSALFGWLIHEDHEAPLPRTASTTVDRAAIAISEIADHRRKGFLPYVWLASLALLPFLWRTRARKPALFALVVTVVSWIQMAITQNGGGGVHHTILLWPFPIVMVAVILGQIRRIPALAVAGVLVAGNLLVMNQYYVQVRRNGGTVNWSDASTVLAERLRAQRPPRIYVVDWGIFDTLRLWSRGTLPIELINEPFSAEPEPGQDLRAAEALASRTAVFVTHTEGNEVFAGNRARLLRRAADRGLRGEAVETISDRNHRPRFEIWRFHPAT